MRTKKMAMTTMIKMMMMMMTTNTMRMMMTMKKMAMTTMIKMIDDDCIELERIEKISQSFNFFNYVDFPVLLPRYTSKSASTSERC
jgi:hypothetical protein